MNIAKLRKSDLVLWGAYLVWIILTIVIAFHHEPWFDEGQQWLIARDLGPLEIIKEMKYEGHMFLWYYILAVFAKTGFSYPYIQSAINLLFAWGFTYIFVRYSPFEWWVKIPFLYTLPVVFVYSAISRCYAIGIFFLFLLTWLYDKKFEKPYLYCFIIFLCANTSVMALFGAATFGLLFVVEAFKTDFYKTREFLFSFVIFLICALSVILQVGGSAGVDVYRFFMPPYNSVSLGLFNAKLPFYAVVSVVLLIIMLLRRSSVAIIYFSVSFLLLGVFLDIFIGGLYRHHGFYFIFLFISFWLYRNSNLEDKSVNLYGSVLLCAISISLCYSGLALCKNDIESPYSYSRSVRNFIIDNKIDKNAVMIIVSPNQSVDTIAYFKDRDFMIDYNTLKAPTYHLNGRKMVENNIKLSDKKFLQIAKRVKNEGKDLYIFFNFRYNDGFDELKENKGKLETVYNSENHYAMIKQKKLIYKVNLDKVLR